MTTKEIIKNTLIRIQKEGRIATPLVYKSIFCQEAKSGNLNLEECYEFENIIKNLDKDIQSLIKANPKVKSIDSLITFLASKIESSHQFDHDELMASYLLLIKELLITLKNLKDEDVTFLAKDTIPKVNSLKDKNSVIFLKDKWSVQNQKIDYNWLNKVDRYIKPNKNSIKSVIEELLAYMDKNIPKEFSKNISSIFSTLLKPSISQDIKKDNEELLEILKKETAIISSRDFKKRVESVVNKRVELDRKEADRKAVEIGEIADILSLKILRVIEQNSSRHKDIKAIQNELGNIDADKINADELKGRLLKISSALDSEVEDLNIDLSKKQKEIEKLKIEINSLKSDLVEAKKEASEDFLTKTVTKRALDTEMERIEGLYLRHKSAYSVVFFDIDHFKGVNDKYGHDAGDKILSVFGNIMTHHARVEDIIGRYGGEEFLAILPETDSKGAVVFAEHIRLLVEKSKFVYQDLQLNITISCGVANRDEVLSKEDLVKKADERLYIAKESGRNRVVSTD